MSNFPYSIGGQQSAPKLSLNTVIRKVTDMSRYDHPAQKLAKDAGLKVNKVSWEDCARSKGSCWGPCISDMTLRVNGSCMPVIRQPNFTDKTWDVKMRNVPIVVGNHSNSEGEALQTISLSDYLSNFSNFMTNDVYRGNGKKKINLLSSKENGDSHVIMSSQACFLPILKGEETKFNVALYNYQSQAKNPAVLVIVSTSKGASAQIIEGRQQHLLFNHNGKKADFLGERVSDVRIKKGQQNVHDKVLSKEEKQDNVIVVVQIPLKKRVIERKQFNSSSMFASNGFGSSSNVQQNFWSYGGGLSKGGGGGGNYYSPPQGMAPQFASFGLPGAHSNCQTFSSPPSYGGAPKPKPNVEAAMVSVSERTTPTCKCKKELQKRPVKYTYNGLGVNCDGCSKSMNDPEAFVYHCTDGKSSYQHRNGYDLCLECGDKQLKFDELRGLLDSVKDYKLERNEEYPVRVTLQYYKATDNGAVNKEIMDDIVKQLEASQKQADFMGSLVTEYDPNRPTEWITVKKGKNEMKVDSEDENGDGYERIRAALQKHCGSDWNSFFENFKNQEVVDSDLAEIDADDLKELIPKMGPRKRFLRWMRETEQ